MKIQLSLVAILIAGSAHAIDLTNKTMVNCIGLVKTTGATAAVKYSHYDEQNVEFQKCEKTGLKIARTGHFKKSTTDLVEVFVRFDNTKTGAALAYRKYLGTSEIEDNRTVLAGEISAEAYQEALQDWISNVELPEP